VVFTEVTIDDLGQIITGTTPPTSKTELFGNEFPFITPTDIDGVNRTVVTERGLSKQGYNYQPRYLLPPNSVCVVCIGATIGKMCITSEPSFTNQQINSIVVDIDNYDPFFVFYLLRLQSDRIRAVSGGAATPIVNKTVFSDIGVNVPPLPTQHKIASILSAYDDLIENNTHRIKILEEMAQSLYREWFVNFRFPSYEKVRMVDSNLGKIPVGWLEKLVDHVDYLEGPGIRNWQYRQEGIPFLNIRTLISNDIDLTKVNYLDEDEVNTKYLHFLLRPYDHVVSSSGTLGRLVTVQSIHLPLMLNTSIIRMRPKSDRAPRWLLKHFLLSDYYQNQINALATGVAQKNYGPAHLKQMWIVVPDEDIARKYEALVEPIEEMILKLVQKNRLLRQIRDLLLPRLISGELDVSDLGIVINDNGGN